MGVFSAVTIPPEELPVSETDDIVVIDVRTFVALFRVVAQLQVPLTQTPIAWSLFDSSEAITHAYLMCFTTVRVTDIDINEVVLYPESMFIAANGAPDLVSEGCVEAVTTGGFNVRLPVGLGGLVEWSARLLYFATSEVPGKVTEAVMEEVSSEIDVVITKDFRVGIS